MNLKLSCLALAITIAGCSSKPVVNTDEPIRNQKLTTSFTEDNVKIETNCVWYKPWKSNCDIIAIEATASAWTNGASSVQVNEARKVARSEALANVSHFIRTQVTSSRVTTVIAKHIEKAKDLSNGQESELTDKESKNLNSRENSNDTARTVTRTIKENSESVLRGFRTVKEEKTGNQEVSVTVRWDLESDRAAKMLQKKF